MLNGNVNVPEIPLQRVLAIHRIGAGGVEHHVHGPHRLVHGMRDGQPCSGDLRARVGRPLANRLPRRSHRFQHIGPGGAENGFRFGYARLHQRPVAKQGGRIRRAGMARQFDEGVHGAASNAQSVGSRVRPGNGHNQPRVTQGLVDLRLIG